MTGLWVLWVGYTLCFFIDVLYVQPYRRRRAAEQGRHHDSGALSFALKAALPIFTVILLLRTFVIDVYHIPSASMRPTLEEGARIWVNRTAFGLRTPITGSRLIGEASPAPGDVVVFKYPREPRTTYVKRILAVPGDRVQVHGDLIVLNGHQFLGEPGDSGLRGATLGQYVYTVIDDPAQASSANIDIVVPEGHYFAIGDNLNNSEDSRVWGLLADRHLLGRVIAM